MSITSERRARERVEMRQLIVNTAIEIYLKEGYEKLSLRGIAQRIEYAVGTIYVYFKDKQEVFYAMHEWAFDKLFEALEPAHDIEDPFERMKLMSRIYVNFAFDNPGLYDLMFIVNEPMWAEVNISDWPCGQKIFELLQKTVAECLERGYLKGSDANTLSALFWSAAHGSLALAMRHRLRLFEDIDPKNLVYGTIELLLKQFINSSK